MERINIYRNRENLTTIVKRKTDYFAIGLVNGQTC